VLTTFFITPLIFVGGVFTSTQFLPPVVQRISYVNPMFHMIGAFRYSYSGTGDVPLGISLAVISTLAVIALAVALRLVAIGYKLRS
jgi:ABC-2 type transport system permease protein